MIVVDTSVLVYASGADHPLQRPCRRLVEEVVRGRVEATTTVEVVGEFAWVFAARRPRADAAARARRYARIFSPLLRPTEEDLTEGLTTFESVAGIGSFDAVLAAVAGRTGATLVSADRGFAAVTGLRYLDPASPTFDEELTRSS